MLAVCGIFLFDVMCLFFGFCDIFVFSLIGPTFFLFVFLVINGILRILQEVDWSPLTVQVKSIFFILLQL